MNIELKPWSINDKERLINLCNEVDRKYLSNRIPYPYTGESADWWLNIVFENEGKNGIFRCIIVNGEIVGGISVEKKPGDYEKDAEIGYMLLDDLKSNGIMTKSVEQICQIAFTELDIIRITGSVYSPNIGSGKVLMKNGFQLEGTMKNAAFKQNKIYDLCIYGKLK